MTSRIVLVKLGMAEQNLDHTNIDVLFQKMGGKAVSQRVQGDTLLDVGHMDRGMAGAVELARRHRLHRITARKQPAPWVSCLPPGAQKREEVRRQHDIAIFAALALLDADQHALAVNVGDLERNYFRGAQTRSIGHAQGRFVFEPWCRIEQARHLFRAEHQRQSSRLMDESRVLDNGISLERHSEEEPQRRHGMVESGRIGTFGHQVQLKTPYVLEARLVGRSADERGQILDRADVALLGLRR
jgi:hypothetical protein